MSTLLYYIIPLEKMDTIRAIYCRSIPNSPYSQSANYEEIYKDVMPVVEETVERFSRMFSSCYRSSPISFYFSEQMGRGFHRPDINTIGLRVEKIQVPETLENTTKEAWRFNMPSFVHELSHHMEKVVPHIRSRCQEFLSHRTHGEQPQSLNEIWLNAPHRTPDDLKICPNGPYKPDEMAKVDNFFKPYCGKINANGETEIFSEGVRLLLKAPEFFKENDPEYFYFIIALMRGEL